MIIRSRYSHFYKINIVIKNVKCQMLSSILSTLLGLSQDEDFHSVAILVISVEIDIEASFSMILESRVRPRESSKMKEQERERDIVTGARSTHGWRGRKSKGNKQEPGPGARTRSQEQEPGARSTWTVRALQ
jgi:hypothetical protein